MINGQQDNSYNFQSSGADEDFVIVSSDPQNQATAGMTLEAWVLPSSEPVLGDMSSIVSYATFINPDTESGYGFFYKPITGKWHFVVVAANDNNVLSQIDSWPGIEIEADTWTHIAGTYDGANAKIFKNGVEEASYSSPGGAIVWENINADLFIGKYIDDNTSFHGSIDEVRIWEIARLQSEIQNSMDEVVSSDQSDLIGYWNFNDNQSLTVSSQVEGGTPGNINNAGNGGWAPDVFAGGNDECFDKLITIDDFPLLHDVIDFEGLEQNRLYNLTELPFENSAAGGQDFTYKLTLIDSANIYFTTCDAQTYLDVEIAILSECDINSATLYNDDAFGSAVWYYPDPTNNINYNFGCTSGIVGNEGYANMIPFWELPPGDHYFVICNRGGAAPTTEGDTWEITSSFGIALTVDSLTTSDDYSEINYHFSEGVYGGDYIDVYDGNLLTLDQSDYQININPNGGAATAANIQNLTKLNGGTLLPGDQNIKLNIVYNASPSGTEEVTVGPFNESSIFNSVGIPLLDLAGITIQLIDALSPTINSTIPEDSQESVEQNSNITITFTEVVMASDNTNISDENSSSCFKLINTENNDVLPFLITTSDNITFILNPLENFPEYTYIRLEVLSGIEDLNDNSFVNNSIQFRTEDVSPPLFQNESSIALTNEFVTISFTEGVYATNSGTGALEVADLALTYNMGENGDCSGVTLTGLRNNSGNILTGGESVIRVLINPNSAPNGQETLFFSAFNNNSIFDLAGNALLIGNSPEVSLNVSAKINNITLPDSNEYADIQFSVGVYGNSDLTIPLNISSLNFDFIQNEEDGGNASTVVINYLKNTENENLSGGESIIRVYMSLDTLPSGVENIIVYPNSNNSIYSFSGVPMPVGENHTVTLKDQLPLTSIQNIQDGEININQNESISIQFDDAVWLPGPPAKKATKEDLDDFFVLQNQTNNIDYIIGIDYVTVLDTINNIYSIYPLEPFSSEDSISYSFTGTVQDISGNQIELNYFATFVIQDYLPPQINANTLAPDDTYWDLYFDDGLFSDFNALNPITPQNFDISIIPNDSDVDSIAITSVTKIDGNFLSGGESILRLNLAYNSTPSGNEFINLNLSQSGQIFDESGNQMEPNSFIAKDTLYDILPPSITSVTLETSIDSLLVLFKERTLQYNFNEKIKSLSYSVTSNHIDSLNVISNISDSSISLTLQPPFASFDSITVNFDEIKDSSDLTTVDIAYTYLTPMLGDYNLDTSINYLDLLDLVDNWKIPNLEYELGPFVGEAPHFISNPDSKFDIEDGMAFMKMWSWYQKTYGEIVDDIEQLGELPRIYFEKSNLIFVLEEDISAGQFQFNYAISQFPPLTFQNKSSNENDLFLTSHSSERGFSIVEFAREESDVKPDTIKILIDSNNKLNLFYTLTNSKKVIIQKGSTELDFTQLPNNLALGPAFPNPFNPLTTLYFDIPGTAKSSLVLLEIYDIKGRSVETLIEGYTSPGRHNIKWNATQFSSGIYFVKLSYDNQSRTQKVILLK